MMYTRYFPKSFFISLALLLSISLLALPIMQDALYAQTAGEACLDAERQAESDINGQTWFLIGCLGGIVGWVVAQAIEPSPPAAPLVGKDADYVAAYTDCYKRKAKNIQTQKALTGCLVGTGVSAVLYVILIVAAAEEAEDDGYYYY